MAPKHAGETNNNIGKLDFPSRSNDERSRLLSPTESGAQSRSGTSPARSAVSTSPTTNGSFFEQVAEGIYERDQVLMKKQIARYGAFTWATITCLCCGSFTAFSLYAPLFMSHLRYSQADVNVIAIAADLAMYLPVPLFGYLSDRYGPRPLALFAGLLFGAGYLAGAFAYRSGPTSSRGGDGWPFWVMLVAFVGIGASTSCMYLAAITTCAKNFGRGKYRGLALAIPIAAFGLSGMWQSQIGSRLLYERTESGERGDVDVFRFFLFLGCTLLGVGIIGTFALRIIDEEEMIEEAIDELEQSGILQEDEFFAQAAHQHGYGTMHRADMSNSQVDFLSSEAEAIKRREEEEQARKEWLLNAETKRFLSDHTMWWLAAGFLFVTGPGEAFINNMGTIIDSLSRDETGRETDAGTTAATHVSIVALTSTVARLLTGTLTDVLAPPTIIHQHRRGIDSLQSSLATLPPRKAFSISRITFLLFFAILMSIGQVVLASGAAQNHSDRFWIVSALVGSGYGAIFSLTPIIISVVWGVENFGTNWGIVAMMPAAGAAAWGIIYSTVYENAARSDLCYGIKCYAPAFWAMAVSVWIACLLWLWAWRGPGGWVRRGIAV